MRSIDLYTSVRAVNNDILERSETAFYGQKETGWLKWGAMAACVSLILTVALTTLPGILRGPGGVLPPPNPAPGPTVSEDDQQNNGEPLQPPGEREITINWDNVAVNESAGLAPGAVPLYRDPALYNEEILDAEGVRTYYGWELAPAYIPDDLTGDGKAVSGRIVREKATGNVVED